MTVEIVNEVSVDLIEASASDDMVAMAAWVSHDADSEDRLKNVDQVRKLINFLYSAKHMSPFEHGHFTFKIDAPLFVAREFFRHRTASYNEVSGRYTEMKPRFYSGTVAREQHGKPGDYYFEDGTNDQTAIYLQTKRKAVKKAWKTYQDRLEAGIAKEQAREELPLSLMTQWYVTMNPRNLMQFLTLRNEKHALKEIQDVAVKMEAIFKEQMPITYVAYTKGRTENVIDYAEKNGALKTELIITQGRLAKLEAEVARLSKNNDVAYQAVVEANRERDEAFRVRDEAVDKFNGAFVTEKEREKADQDDWSKNQVNVKYEAEIKDGTVLSGITDIENLLVDKIVPRVGRIVESAAPVYNVYLDIKNKDNSAIDIGRAVSEQLKKMERRRAR